MTRARREFGVDRMAISGGECTLNRRWLVHYLTELRRLNRDDAARLHVDTNAVILTPDYIDELVEAGMTDIGPDVKGLTTATFMRITNVHDALMPSKLLETEWNAVRYLVDRYFGRIFIGVGITYNPSLISLDEIHRMGLKLANMEPGLPIRPSGLRTHEPTTRTF
jgi:pyruvate formate lyase activating enzyme